MCAVKRNLRFVKTLGDARRVRKAKNWWVSKSKPSAGGNISILKYTQTCDDWGRDVEQRGGKTGGDCSAQKDKWRFSRVLHVNSEARAEERSGGGEKNTINTIFSFSFTQPKAGTSRTAVEGQKGFTTYSNPPLWCSPCSHSRGRSPARWRRGCLWRASYRLRSLVPGLQSQTKALLRSLRKHTHAVSDIYIHCRLGGTVPKMGFPRGVFPPKVKTWEWSAVTTVRVSDSLVSCAARWMALSNITVSVNASFAMPSWWPWSILPRIK